MSQEEDTPGELTTARDAPQALEKKETITTESSGLDRLQKLACDDVLLLTARPFASTTGISQTGSKVEGNSVSLGSTNGMMDTTQHLDSSPNISLPETADVPTELDSRNQKDVSSGMTIISGERKPYPQWDRLQDLTQPSQPAPLPNSTIPGSGGGVSEWSHQQLVPQKDTGEEQDGKNDEWQEMPAFAPYNLYDDEGKLIAHEQDDSDDETNPYANLGGAAKGYTRVQVDEDAQSATSMDDNTAYLFKGPSEHMDEDEDEQRDPLAQMRATKNLLTDNQRIAYVGVVRLAMAEMAKELQALGRSKSIRKEAHFAIEAMKMWSQKMMVRLYGHMELDAAEQIMIEQLADHGLQPEDLTPTLMQNSRVKNPVVDTDTKKHTSNDHPRPDPPKGNTYVSGSKSVDSLDGISPKLPTYQEHALENSAQGTSSNHRLSDDLQNSTYKSHSAECLSDNPSDLPPYQEYDPEDMPDVRTPSQLPYTNKIDIDLRWTVLCDLFLALISDSIYDARSRTLLERVGSFLEVPWLEICRFEKRVTDALEMQEAAQKENWDEATHMAKRQKNAKNRRLVMIGLATVGGGLVIGLSAGLMAPLIGAGLAAGFTTIGVTGSGGFLAGAGGAAIIGTGGVLTGGAVGGRAANRRTGAVKTFEYRPLHNNKRVNLIVTVAGWMNGKVDDVRLPFSTVDPIMGDIYSVLWEPEMLRSMGDTINILATEALTSGLQQILGSTVLVALMASLQLPIVLTKLSYLIDNPWSVSQARADLAGLILADSLIDRNLGARPITLVGFSIGSRVIFACLQELAKKGALGLVQNAYLFGTPKVVKREEYLRAKTVVSGRFVNAYATNDWILGYLFRATSGGISRVAGLAAVELPGIENLDVTEFVPGHMAYRAAMPRLLREVGWAVESDEFAEIEDPDPDNHEKRQRELINEIEVARMELQKKPEKKRFGLFKTKKLAEKKAWETYDDRLTGGVEPGRGENADATVLFDFEAIRAEVVELAAQGVRVKALDSTLPPIKVDASALNANGLNGQRDALRETKSFDASPMARPDHRPKATSRSFDYNEYDDRHVPTGKESISMTFDTSDPEPPRLPSPEREVSMLHLAPPEPPNTPPAKHFSHGPPPWSTTSPVPETSTRFGHDLGEPDVPANHNVWADDEDDDFGTEKELQMTFE